MAATTGSVPDSQSIVIVTDAHRGRGIDALLQPVPAVALPLRSLAIDAQSLALRSLESIERDGERDDIRCNWCLNAWIDGNIPHHLESCPVGRVLENSRFVLDELKRVEVYTHEERAKKVAGEAAFPAGEPRGRLVEEISEGALTR